MTDWAIEAEGLSRDYGTRRALDSVSLAVHAGRVVGLLGPNGAGKTTLLRLLAGLIEPTEGSAAILGEDVRALREPLIRERSVLLDGHEPPGWTTPLELMDLESEAAPQFDEAFARRFIGGHGIELNKPYRTLSKGQKRWVLNGLCLAGGAKILLLDEPADGLDPAARRELYGHLRDWANERQATILAATHIIHDIERVADDVAFLCRGRLVLHESLETLREELREVEIPGSAPLPPLPEGVQLRALERGQNEETLYVRADEPSISQLERWGGVGTMIRPVGLEGLYMALVGGRPGGRSPDQPEESAPRDAGNL